MMARAMMAAGTGRRRIRGVSVDLIWQQADRAIIAFTWPLPGRLERLAEGGHRFGDDLADRSSAD